MNQCPHCKKETEMKELEKGIVQCTNCKYIQYLRHQTHGHKYVYHTEQEV